MSTIKLTIALLLIGGLASGCGDLHGDPGQQGRTRSNSYSAAMETFDLLQGPTEAFPRPLQLHVGHLLNRKGNSPFYPILVQRARTPDGVAWVFLEGSEVCLVQGQSGSVACSPQPRAEAEGVSLGAFTPPSKRIPRPHDFLLMGLAPDGIRKVVVTIGKRRQKIAVRDNLFSASGSQPILIKQLVRAAQ